MTGEYAAQYVQACMLLVVLGINAVNILGLQAVLSLAGQQRQ